MPTPKFRPIAGGIEGEYIVALNELPANGVAFTADSLARKHGARVRTVWTRAMKGFLASMSAMSAREMSADPRVRYVQQNVSMQASAPLPNYQQTNLLAPTDRDNVTPGKPYPTSLERSSLDPPPPAHPLWHLWRMNNRQRSADPYYRYDSTGAGVRIYVVDTGVVRFHQEFIANGGAPASGTDKSNPDQHSRVQEVLGSDVAPQAAQGATTGDGDGYPSSAPFAPAQQGANIPCTPPNGSPTLEVLNVARNPTGTAVPFNDTIWFTGRNDFSHGTAVASVAAGRNVGVAKEATIVPVKVTSCDDQDRFAGDEARFITAFDWILGDVRCEDTPQGQTCTRVPAVVTMSTYRAVTRCDQNIEGARCAVVGTTAALPTLVPLEEAIGKLLADGVPFVTSANNNSRDACNETPGRMSWSGGYKDLGRISRGVINVGGLAKDTDDRWIDTDVANNPGSNWGPCIDLFAPAERIAVADPSAWDDYRDGPIPAQPEAVPPIPARSSEASGTSFSAPAVAGLIARMLSEDETLRGEAISPDAATRAEVPKKIWERLRDSATPFQSGLEYDAALLSTNPTHVPTTNAIFRATKQRIAYMGTFGFGEYTDALGAKRTQPRPVVLGDAEQELKIAPITGATYRWYIGESGDTSNAVPAAIGSSSTLCVQRNNINKCVAPGENTRYWVRATRNNRHADSAAATVVVNAPVILEQPESTWVVDGAPRTLRVTALPQTGVTYQWFQVTGRTTQTLIPGANQATYTVTDTTATRGYLVEVTYSGTTIPSDVALVRACPSTPTISGFAFNPPIAAQYQFPDFNVTVQATGAVDYQWYAGESGDVSRPLNDGGGDHTINLRGGDHSKIWVRALTTCGYRDSQTVTLPICSKFKITQSTNTSRRVAPNAVTIMSVRVTEANGSGALWSYQWYRRPGGSSGDYVRDDRLSGSVVAIPPNTVLFEGDRSYTYRALVSDGVCGVFSEGISLNATSSSCQAVARPGPELSKRQMLFAGGTISVPLAGTDASSNYEWWRDTDIGNPHQTVRACNQCSAATLQVFESGWYFPRIQSCYLTNGNATEDTERILVEVAPCGADGFKIHSDPSYIGVATAFRLLAPPSPVAGSIYRWYKGTGTTTPLATTTTPYYDVAGGVTEQTIFWVEIDPVTPDGCITRPLKSAFLPLTPCGRPKRRSVSSPGSGTAGQLRTLTVTDPEADVTYDWYQRTSTGDLKIGTGTSISISPAQTTTYFYRASRTCPDGVQTEDSDLVTVVVTCPLILDGPRDAIAFLPGGGLNATVGTSVTVTGSAPYRYQWIVDDIAQAQSAETYDPTSSYSWSWNQVGDRKVAVRVTDACGADVTSPPVTISIKAQACGVTPTIGARWGSGWIYVGGQAKWVGVSMDPPRDDYTYQWYRGDGTPINGKTDAQTYLTTYDLDSYYVKITSPCGVVYSPKIYLYVYGECLLPPLTVTQTKTALAGGDSVTFTATCDFNDVHFQWYGGQSGDTRYPIDGDPGNPAQLTRGYPVASYWVRASRSCGAYVDSSTLTYTVSNCKPNLITAQPVSLEVPYGATDATLSVGAADAGSKFFSWFNVLDTQPAPPRAATQAWTLPPVTASGRYFVEVRDKVCASTASAWSIPASVRVASCPSLTPPVWPTEVWADRDTSATLAATTGGATGYTWYAGELGDTSTPAGTGAVFVTPAVTADTPYWVRVQGNGCIVDSPTILVKVCNPPALQPSFHPNQNIVSGQTTRFWANAVGTDLSYEWFEGASLDTSKPIGRNIDMLEVRPAVTTKYWVRITGHCGADRVLNSPTMTASVCPIVGEPAATKTVVMPGTTTQLSIGADGTQLEYQWYYGSSGVKTQPVPNGKAASITTPPITAATTFWCEVKSGGCERYSVEIQISLCSEPTIQWIHGDKYAASGEAVDLRVSALSSETPSYTFYSGPAGNVAASTVIYGPAASSAFTVRPTETKTYWVRAVAGDCRADTPNITVNVCVPTITQQPAGGTLVSGTGSFPLSVATDMPAVSYQWYAGAPGTTSSPVPDSNKPAIAVTPAADTQYWVRITGCGNRTVNSNAATVAVCNPPVLRSQSIDTWIVQGAAIDIRAHVDGTGLVYRWYRGAKNVTTDPVANPNGSWIRVTPSQTTQYWAHITGSCGEVKTETITVNVCAPPVIAPMTVNPIFRGTSATLTASATTATSTPLTYQWYSGTAGGGSAIAGATSQTYQTPVLTSPANYWVEVKTGNAICTTASDTITVPMCTFDPVVPGAEHKIGYNETATLSLPVMSPVVSKNVVWYRGAVGDKSTPVRSGVNVSYTTPQLTASAAYWAEFEYEGCVSRTNAYAVNVCKPQITTPPANVTIASGATTPLTVATTNIPGQTIRWYQGAIGSTTTEIGTAASVSVNPTATTSYWVRVSSCGLNADAAVTVTVCTPPAVSIVTPSPRNLESGKSAQLQTYAAGSNITYQWFTGTSGTTTSPIAGATSDWLTVSPAATTSYWCRVTSYGVCVTNGPTIVVDVCTKPAITAHPISTRAFSGAATTLSVAATSSKPLTYQWYRGASGDTSQPIGGATSSSVTVNPTVETTYWVRVTGSVCTSDSNAATVSMCALPQVVPGAEHKIGYNETATLSLPTMSPVVDKNVTWYQGAVGVKTTPVRSGINASYTTPALTATTTYWAEFEYQGCISRTDAYTVNVCKPKITTQPVGTTIASGTSATLTVATTAIAGQTIQWYAGPAGTTTTAAGNTATITVAPTSTTTYWCRVSSPCGLKEDSVAATVTVCTPPVVSIVTPSPRYIRSGQQTSLQTYAAGSGITYQWYIGTSGTTASPVSGATSDWLTVTPAANTNYWCRVTANGVCTTNGPTITVDVCTNPTITTQPASQRIFSGKATALSVVASSSRPLTYQWYIGAAGDVSQPIGGATGASVTVSPAVETNYWVRVINGVCTVDSNTATLSMCTYPETVAGASYDTTAGQSVTLSLPTMSPVDNKNVVWYQGAVGVKTTPVRSGVNVSHTVAPTVTTAYWAEFEHNGCISRTGAYTVNVCKPAITAHPQNQVVISGQAATLSVTATGAPLTYQWYRGNAGDVSQPIGGATGNSYNTGAMTADANYWVRVTGCTVADSTTASVKVCTTPGINSITKDPWTSIGGTGSITVSASGTNLTYQWYKGLSGDTTAPIAGATSPTYTFTRQVSQYLWVRVTTSCNNTYVDSVATMYSVDPKITLQPQSVTIPRGTSTTLSVTATGTYLSYQWYSYTTGLVSGATSSSFTTPALTAETSYYVKVTSGSNGAAYSAYATVSVCDGPQIDSMTAQFYSPSWYKFNVNVAYWQQAEVKYLWYRGPVGNTTASTFLGEEGSEKWISGITTTTTIWVRVMWLDDTCYRDIGRTVP